MIAGEDKPDKGAIQVGETVKLMYVTQDRMGLDGDAGEKTVWLTSNNAYAHISDVCSWREDGLSHLQQRVCSHI